MLWNDRWIHGKSLIDLQASINQEVMQPGATVVADLMMGKQWSSRALLAIIRVKMREV